MTSRLPRTTFNRSGLVRILSETIPEPLDPKYDFGERLGQWLDFSDALALFSALNSRAGAPSTVPGKSDSAARPLYDQLSRVRQNLTESIIHDGVFSSEAARIRFPVPLPQATAESAADYSHYHRYYLAHQRDMSASIGALRAGTRKVLAEASIAHQQLADLDGTLEKALAVRERNLLGVIPMLLARRFAERYQAHRDVLAESGDDPAYWTKPGSWLEAFCRDAQAVLLAELDLRLKPVAGLIAALGDDSNPLQVTKQ